MAKDFHFRYPAQADRVTQAMMGMVKLAIGPLERTGGFAAFDRLRWGERQTTQMQVNRIERQRILS
jgi:hypothetical protein